MDIGKKRARPGHEPVGVPGAAGLVPGLDPAGPMTRQSQPVGNWRLALLWHHWGRGCWTRRAGVGTFDVGRMRAVLEGVSYPKLKLIFALPEGESGDQGNNENRTNMEIAAENSKWKKLKMYHVQQMFFSWHSCGWTHQAGSRAIKLLSWLLLEVVSSGEERHIYQQANEKEDLPKLVFINAVYNVTAQHHIQDCIILSLVKTVMNFAPQIRNYEFERMK
ncbi:hypothetical protein DUI87_10986 [Hirundo rustica rustica]|uniref:Uncharacterized protein n=1 Tax=Hirundo rustica rustica TaxID=333673 RepID=A0A3M0KJL5_HIRRU|nr:hypothetical protein DUI87_10986 [Hirundo rustica rustica]